MNIKIKKILTIIMLLLILFTQTESIGAENLEDISPEEIKSEIKIEPRISTIEENVTIPVDIYIKNDQLAIMGIDVVLEYNSEVFHEVKAEDVVTELETYIFEYHEDDKSLQIVFDENIKEGIVATINLKPKQTITDEEKRIELLKIYDMYIAREDNYTEYIEKLETALWGIGEKLYLSTENFKIGNNDINNYEEGDKYISRIEEEITKEEFIASLETNGTIKIIKQDGTELGENELVGTGMTIEVTKDEQKIELQIAVIGDLDGNGKITATDLSALNQTILKTVTLENEYLIAGDFDENENITATDLSTLNKMLLKIL